jgi:hypothetical protein
MQNILDKNRELNTDIEVYPFQVLHNRGHNACSKAIFYSKVIPAPGGDLTGRDCVSLDGKMVDFGEGVFCGSCSEPVTRLDISDIKERESNE